MEEALGKALGTILYGLRRVTIQKQVNQKDMTKQNALKLFSKQVLLRFWHISQELSPDLIIKVTKFIKGLVLSDPNDEALLLKALKDLLSSQDSLRKGQDNKSFLVIRCILDQDDDEDQEWQVLIKKGSTAGNESYQQLVTGRYQGY